MWSFFGLYDGHWWLIGAAYVGTFTVPAIYAALEAPFWGRELRYGAGVVRRLVAGVVRRPAVAAVAPAHAIEEPGDFDITPTARHRKGGVS